MSHQCFTAHPGLGDICCALSAAELLYANRYLNDVDYQHLRLRINDNIRYGGVSPPDE